MIGKIIIGSIALVGFVFLFMVGYYVGFSNSVVTANNYVQENCLSEVSDAFLSDLEKIGGVGISFIAGINTTKNNKMSIMSDPIKNDSDCDIRLESCNQ